MLPGLERESGVSVASEVSVWSSSPGRPRQQLRLTRPASPHRHSAQAGRAANTVATCGQVPEMKAAAITFLILAVVFIILALIGYLFFNLV